jgi:pimeloyl-ACP methyl ester carboxylesterase
MSMVGADHERLLEAVGAMRRAADDLDSSQNLIQRVLSGVAWFGQLAANFVGVWDSSHRRNLMTTSQFIRDAANELERQAIQQREASSAASSGVGRPGHVPKPFTASPGVHPQPQIRKPVSLRQVLDRQEQLPGNQFEILKVSENPPRYIVNLPGIEWSLLDPWAREHERDLPTAVSARLAGMDAYAAKIKAAMRSAGIPAGAEVMLVGHSYGAIAAMNIAADQSFNRPGDTDGSDGYSVQVTHVLAAGAGVRDWIDDPPEGTKVLMMINRADVVASAIQQGAPASAVGTVASLANPLLGLGRTVDGVSTALNIVAGNSDHSYTPHGSERMVVEFSSKTDVLGHHYDNYENGLASMGTAADWFVDDAARMYFTGGGTAQAARVDVPDGGRN